MAKPGAPNKYDEWLKPENIVRVQGWKMHDGLNDKQVAEKMGISHHTLKEWKRKGDVSKQGEVTKFTPFTNALKIGKETAVRRVENKLFESAISGNLTAIIFYLKNYARERFNDGALSVEERELISEKTKRMKLENVILSQKVNASENGDNVEELMREYFEELEKIQ